ncbi:MAG TPA: PSD1 and planctomycete cytochrome C domain-containing protein [Verrucomicrobiota bacterium]|nr:PSD1 and planctomycete cytochrome C domain-containing protein [Verrucomicrobiota bacterium]
MNFVIRFCVAVVLSVGISLGAADLVDYGREVLPILSKNCIQCHGPDEEKREAKLRLDQRVGALEQLAPGKPEESEVVARIETNDEDDVMPPPDSKFTLTAADRKTLRRWIVEGAKYTKHWAFVHPVKADVAPGDDGAIDALILHRLKQDNLILSPSASAETLCRRIHLDLVGLPPSPQESAAFAVEAKAGLDAAVESLVNRLIAKPAFGEKWARHWLDAARYADTHGFEKDMPRQQWAWRDWVIEAINNDMPYDRFIIEQIAGDLLPDRTQDQLVATGFLRNGMVNEEGAIVYEQFRLEGVMDRMDCLGKAVLGLALQCAQCHTHKFDPITQNEYYGMFAFLNDVHEAQSSVYTAAQEQQIIGIRGEVAKLVAPLRSEAKRKQELADWAGREARREAVWDHLDTTEHVWEGGLNHPEPLADHSILVLGHPSATGHMYIEATPKRSKITAVRIEGLRYGDLPFGGPGRSPAGTFAITEVTVFSKAPDQKEWQAVKLAGASADFSEPEKTLEQYFKRGDKSKPETRKVGPAAFMVDGKAETGWRSDRGPVLRETDSAAMVRLAKPLKLPEGGQIKVRLAMNHGGDQSPANHQLGRVRFGVTDAPEPKLPPYNHAATLALAKRDSDRTKRDREAIFRAWRQGLESFAEVNAKIAALEKTFPEARTSVLHLASTPIEHQRATHLLDRGVWDRPKHKVEPGTPAIFHPVGSTEPTRLDFARWLVDKRSPLAARVQVNRVWQAIFGRGLVETSEDFGASSGTPELQDVLDWLAVDFMENGWSLKHLVRQIVGSRTYRQRSIPTPELIEADPANRLLARGPRFRAEAEIVRDIALSAAGLLHAKVGGPSIYPPVPQSMLDYNFIKIDYWNVPTGADRYRRSLYLFRKRTMPDPVMTSFDAPNSDFACARRTRSNTPLAALVSLNEPVFVEAAQAMARRILREGGGTEAQRIDYGYRLTTGRGVKPGEQEEVLRLLASQRQRLAEGWIPIDDIAFSDIAPRGELPGGVTPQDVAAWTIVSRVLLNLDETMTKN